MSLPATQREEGLREKKENVAMLFSLLLRPVQMISKQSMIFFLILLQANYLKTWKEKKMCMELQTTESYAKSLKVFETR